jgi:hypothetical protein
LFCVTNVKNGRVQREVAILQLVQEHNEQTVSDLKARLAADMYVGIDPESVWALGDELGMMSISVGQTTSLMERWILFLH